MVIPSERSEPRDLSASMVIQQTIESGTKEPRATWGRGSLRDLPGNEAILTRLPSDEVVQEPDLDWLGMIKPFLSVARSSDGSLYAC